MGTMDSEVRTVVTFSSTAFNTTEPKDYFINPCCFGDDVAKWLIVELRKQMVKTDEKPGQEDFGWYLNFEVTGSAHTFVVGHRHDGESDTGTWIGWLERKRGFVISLLGTGKRGIKLSAGEVLQFETYAGTSNETSTRGMKNVEHHRRKCLHDQTISRMPRKASGATLYTPQLRTYSCVHSFPMISSP
jgi:hypothetical protein